MLQGLLSLAVVLSAAGVRAQNLEAPGEAPKAEPAAPSGASGPTGFGAGGQFILSAEKLFGYNWKHESIAGSSNVNAFTLLANPFGVGAYSYDWPRVGFDYFVTQSISAGLAASFARITSGNASNNAWEIAPRLGYGMMVGPWLAVWPRAGVTYVSSTGQSYLGLTIDLQAVVVVAPHLAITFAPVANIGLSGTKNNANDKITTLGAEFGLLLPL
jgi:hypothetical protein